MEEELTGSRVTRSLRKRLNSTDREGSPVIATSKNGGPTPVKATSQLGAITEYDLTSDSEETGAKKPTKVVLTRARAASTLTEENVQLHLSPARRITRRNSCAMEPSTPSSLRRSTRASSITSDDVSVNSNVTVKTRRTLNIDKTLKEEDEKPSTSAMLTRSTGSPIPNPKATQEKQKASISPSTPPNQEITANPSTKEITATPPSSKKRAIPANQNLKKSELVVEEYLSESIVSNDSDDVASNQNTIASSQLETVAVTVTEIKSEVLDESNKGTPVTKKQSRSSDKSAKKTLDVDVDAEKSPDTQTLAKQTSEQLEPQTSENDSSKSDTKVVETKNDSSQLDPKTSTKKSSDVNMSVTKNDFISSPQLDVKSPTSESDANKSIGKENDEISSPQLGLKTPDSETKSLNTKTDNSFVSKTMNELQHSDIDFAGTGRASPMLNVKQRTPLKKGVSHLNSSTPIITLNTTPAAKGKSKDSLLNVTPKPDLETMSAIETKGLQSGSSTFSRSWGQAVVGTAVNYIDGLARQKKPEEEEVIKSTNVSVSSHRSNKSVDNTFEESEEKVDDVKEALNGFINDEAEEAEEDDEDSMDEEEKQYIRENEIPERDVSLGSDDSSVDDAVEASASSMDSFIVSDSEDYGLLDGTGDDLSLEASVQKDKSLRKSHRIIDTSDEDEVKTQEVCITTKTDDERPPKAGLSKSFVGSKKSKKITKLNKSVGQEPYENIDESVVSKGSSASNVDKSNMASPSKKQTKAGLSKSLVEPKFTKKDLKLNKSVDISAKNVNKANDKAPSSVKIGNDDVQDLQQPENSADDTNRSSETVQIEHITSPVPENKRKRSIAATDCEVSTPPFAKSPVISVKKKPNYDEIVGRCDSILKEALVAKLEQKLQNKIPITDEKVHKLKSKKEQKQLAKARRAAALIEIEKQAIEKAEKKRLKKEARALKQLENPEGDKVEAVTKVQAVSKAINHGITLLSKKLPKNLPIIESSVVPDEPVQIKSKKRKLNTTVDEVVTKKHYKSIDHSDAVIKQGQAKRKQEPPAEDFDAEPVSQGTLKKRKVSQLLTREQISEPPITINKNTTATPFEQADDVVNIPPQKKMKKHIPSLSNIENDSTSTAAVSSKKPKKKLNILLTKSENNMPLTVAKPKAFDANVLKITPKPVGFKEHSKSSAGQNDKKPKQKKKKEIVERVTVLPKPQWTASGAFEVSTLSTDTASDDVLRFSTATDFVVASLKPKPHKVKSTASEFKQRAMFNDSVKRESSKQLLQRKEKQMAYTRF